MVFCNFKKQLQIIFQVKNILGWLWNTEGENHNFVIAGDPQVWTFSLELNYPGLLIIDAFFEALTLLCDEIDYVAAE